MEGDRPLIYYWSIPPQAPPCRLLPCWCMSMKAQLRPCLPWVIYVPAESAVIQSWSVFYYKRFTGKQLSHRASHTPPLAFHSHPAYLQLGHLPSRPTRQANPRPTAELGARAPPSTISLEVAFSLWLSHRYELMVKNYKTHKETVLAESEQMRNQTINPRNEKQSKQNIK